MPFLFDKLGYRSGNKTAINKQPWYCGAVLADGIASANVVGYTSKDVAAGKYYLIGVQFNDTASASKGSVDMNTLIKLSETITPGTYDADFAGAPELLVLNAAGTGYDKYYYISDATDDNDDPLGYDCWADGDGYELEDADKLILGKGFWFKSATAGSITVSGEVTASADQLVSFPANTYAIIANPSPVAFSFANVTTTGITPGTYDADFAGASEILTLNAAATGYDKFYFISDATDDNDDPVGYNCWSDGDGYILEGNQVEAGASFWIKGNAAGTMGFTK